MTRNKFLKENYRYVNEEIVGKIIGSVIKEARTKKKMSIKQLALLSGVNKNTISRTEKGKLSIVTDKLFKVVVALDISMIDLWHEVDYFCVNGCLFNGKTEEIFND